MNRENHTPLNFEGMSAPSPVLEPRPSLIGGAARRFAFSWAFLKERRILPVAFLLVAMMATYVYTKLRPSEKVAAKPEVALIQGASGSDQEPRKMRLFPDLVDEATKQPPLPEKLIAAEQTPPPNSTAPGVIPMLGGNEAGAGGQRPSSSSMMLVQNSHDGRGSGSVLERALLPITPAAAAAAAPKTIQSLTAPQVRASRLTNRTYLLARGAFIPCILETQLVSTLPGQTKCVLPETIYSDDGRLVLLEKGSQVVGEYGSTLQAGEARLAIIWNRIKTPSGVVVDLDSPAADSVGANGAPGYVDNKWMERFGQAILLSLVEDAIQIKLHNQQAGSSTSVNFFPQNTVNASQGMVNRMIDANIKIAPVLYKNRGDRLMIFVNKDIDFESVYLLDGNK